ncbi:hypothetical protein V1512DRAFT_266935, partial [Lipomyces arxii]|uniref:uncharacterized protein n=1 Tax=Lipomyces arxii TaxID=56418 RepID=UPI0034CDDD4C
MAETFEDDLPIQARPLDYILTDHTEIIDIRAFQRTYEGAYFRTAMLEVTMSLSILRIFDIEFYPIGALYAVIGFSFVMIGLFRRFSSNKYILNNKPAKYFLTSGTPVGLMTLICLVAYIAMIPEVFRL